MSWQCWANKALCHHEIQPDFMRTQGNVQRPYIIQKGNTRIGACVVGQQWDNKHKDTLSVQI